jgi:pimeloyl-ACP methyl ester carboxylesterase
MKLNYKKSGQGQPLLILHGVFGSLDNWQSVGNKFAENYEVYLIDQRNHGKSPHSDEFSYESMSDDLGEFIEHHGLKEPIVLGHSMGGKTAMKFACNHPEKLEKLIVVDIAPKYYEPHHQKIIEGFRAVNIRTIDSRKEAEDQMSKVIHSQMIRQFLLKNLTRTDDGFRWKINLDAIEKSIENIGNGLDDSEKFEKPTLFISGSNSDYILDKDIPIIKKHFPNYKHEIIVDAGHWVHAEQPLLLYEEVVDFLS